MSADIHASRAEYHAAAGVIAYMSIETDEQIAREVEALLRGVTLATCRNCNHDDTTPYAKRHAYSTRSGMHECYVLFCRCVTYSPYSEPPQS